MEAQNTVGVWEYDLRRNSAALLRDLIGDIHNLDPKVDVSAAFMHSNSIEYTDSKKIY